MAAKQIYEFGPYRLDPDERLLLRAGRPVALTPKAFDTLVALVENSGHLVKKDDLMKRVWPGTFVEEVNLAQNVSALRRALHTNGEQYIETVPKLGYRLTVKARVVSDFDGTGDVPQVLLGTSTTQAPTALLAEAASDQPPRLVGWRNRGIIAISLGIAGLLGVAALAWRDRARQPAGKSGPIHIESLAVLPLENLSKDPEQEYFADGMTDALITDLAKIHALRVISRTSVMRYKGRRPSVSDLARDLNVDAIVEGTVMRAGDRVMITAQLIEAPRDRHLWADSYERDLRDVVALQDDVAKAIAGEIKVTLTAPEETRLSSARPVDPAAQEAYLRGTYELHGMAVKPTPELKEQAVNKAAEYFEQA